MSNAAFKRRNAELRALQASKTDTFEVTFARTVSTSAVKTVRNGVTKKGKKLFRSTVGTRVAMVTGCYVVSEPKTGIGMNPNYNWTGPRLGMF